MTIQDLGSLGELIAALATILTLLYLAVQIRNNTKATRASTSLSVNDSLTTINNALRSDSEFTDIWLRGCHDLASLNDVERVRFITHALEILYLTQYIYELEQQELADAHIDYIPWITVLYRDNPGFRAFVDSLEEGWAGSKDLYDRIRNVELAKGHNIFGMTKISGGET